MADVRAQGGSLLFELVATSGWPALLLHEGPLAYQPRNAVDILTSQSLFTNYFPHYGSRCTHSPTLCIQYLELRSI